MNPSGSFKERKSKKKNKDKKEFHRIFMLFVILYKYPVIGKVGFVYEERENRALRH